jgi:hypothetical protein
LVISVVVKLTFSLRRLLAWKQRGSLQDLGMGVGAGIESIMLGDIMPPEYSRHVLPGISDADIVPATVAPKLLTRTCDA